MIVTIIMNWFLVSSLKTKMANIMRALIVITAVAVASDLFAFASRTMELAYWSQSLFYVSIDWILVCLLIYMSVYTGQKIIKHSWKRVIMPALLVDSFSLLLNPFFHHEFEMDIVTYRGEEYNVAVSMFIPYYLHLAICYVLAALILIILVQKSVTEIRFYQGKYLAVLFPFAVVLVVDGSALIFKLPVNYSVLAYALMIVIIRYYSLSFVPRNLVMTTVMLAVETMDSGVICFDMDGKYAFSNKSLWTFFGRTEADPEAAEELLRSRNADYNLDEKDKFRWDDMFEIKGEKVYLICEYSKIYDETHKFVGSYFHIVNSTESVKENQREVEKYRNENAAKSEFFSRISHEIRTPINSVYGMNEMILRECGDEQILEYSRDIKTSTEMIIGIVDDVLDYSNIDSGHLVLQKLPYNPHEIFEETAVAISESAKEKGLEIIMDIQPNIPKSLIGDGARLKQIVGNLLSNAVKYTKEGTVTLSASCRRKDDCVMLSVSVADTGIGIRREDIPRLYMAYDRVEDVKHHSIRGTGLGINITVQLLKLMGSELMVDSEFGKGSTFSFTLEQKESAEAPVREPVKEKITENKTENITESTGGTAQKPYAGRKILIVDDSAMNRKVLGMLLKNSGADIMEASGGIQGMQMIKDNRFDLVFLDHMMPDLNGVELFERLKSIDHINKTTPFVMLTANVADNPRQRYLDIGFDEYIAKPVNPQLLEECLKQFLG